MNKFMIFAAALAVTGTSANAADKQYNLRVDGMTCPFCVATSEKALKKIKGVTKVSTNLKSGTISVCTNTATGFSDPQLKVLFSKKGFTYRGKTAQKSCTIKTKG